ncbi:alpha/beta hydrolase [Sphaerisporangium flaviroseum]|uniref:Alpha/beta hydrolase n=1 Tax=Sphaerisporangium flaviroseum TaxID=509199 RepID=A0ABP7IED5_9ACTN
MTNTLRIVLAVVGALALLAPPAAASRGTACSAPVPSETRPGYLVADPACDFPSGTPFTALPGATAHTGIAQGAAYRVEVPDNWNGELVLHAHGYRGQGTTVYVDNPSLRAHLIARGYAWAASSYQTNGYDVGQGVKDSYALISLARNVTGRSAKRVYMTGLSMGGHVTAVAIEHYRGAFAGALPACGVLADTELFDYFTDANVTAAALTGTRIEFPLNPGPEFQQAYADTVLTQELPKLGSGFTSGTPPVLSETGRTWAAAVEQRSGGTRPGFDAAFLYWNGIGFAPLTQIPFLFGLYPGLSGGTSNIAPGNVVDNRHTVYQLDGRPALTAAEWRLNRQVLRVRSTASASRDLTGIPAVQGSPRIPVLSLHDLGDLFVPFSMEQIYAARAARHGRAHNFVSRAIRGVGHCDFTGAELRRAFDDLVTWVETGRRADGDRILSRAQVARPTFGCRFTEGTRPSFPACPKA